MKKVFLIISIFSLISCGKNTSGDSNSKKPQSSITFTEELMEQSVNSENGELLMSTSWCSFIRESEEDVKVKVEFFESGIVDTTYKKNGRTFNKDRALWAIYDSTLIIKIGRTTEEHRSYYEVNYDELVWNDFVQLENGYKDDLFFYPCR